MDREVSAIEKKPSSKGKKLMAAVIIILTIALCALSGMFFLMNRRWDREKNSYIEEVSRYSKSLSDASYIVIYDNGVNKSKTSLLEDVPVNEYKSENLITDKSGFKHYRDDTGTVVSSVGIDVSYHQGKIYWDNVKAAGVDYAMLRAGYRGYGSSGDLQPDKLFDQNASGALKAGLDIGVYFFSQAITPEEAREEAKYILERIKKYDITYPVVYDWEEITDKDARTDGLSGEIITQCAVAFCEEVKAAGYTPMIYANIKDSLFHYKLSELAEYDFWLAEYDDDSPSFIYNFRMWQYSSTGIVDGISAYVDLNICYEPYTKKQKEDN